MLSYNKKIAKVSFFLFLFFSFFTLGFTITNVSAYTSEDMPEGYRQITSDDENKIFGVDLETTIYFATDSTPSGVGGFFYFATDDDTYPRLFYAYGCFTYQDRSGTDIDFYDNATTTWLLDTYTLTDGMPFKFSPSPGEDIPSLVSDYSFIYVKDIDPVPTLIESILSLFNKLIIWIPSVITGLIALFYSSESGLTFLGALAVAGLGIGVIFLLIGIIQNFLHFRG